MLRLSLVALVAAAALSLVVGADGMTRVGAAGLAGLEARPAPGAVPGRADRAAAEPVEGVWRAGNSSVRIEPTGPGAFHGVVIATDARCFRAGEVVWQLRGSGTSYTGTDLWKDLETCGTFGEARSTWQVAGDALHHLAVSPRDGSDVRVSVWTRDTSTGTPERPALDVGLPAQPDVFPQANTAALKVSVSQNGTVVTRPARSGASARADPATVRCGVAGFVCFDRADRNSAVTLLARAARGFRFVRWSGACSGTRPECRLTLAGDRDVAASFAPQRSAAAVGASLARPRLQVGWSASIGNGTLTVRGRVTRAARLRIELRRPGGAPLLTRVLRARGGPFRAVVPLRPGRLARGAVLLPGGFLVVLRGRSGSLPVPLQVQTVELPAPAEGVVRRSYASATERGPTAAELPRGTREAWAHFVFEAQPRPALDLTVAWFNPAGALVGTVEKPNRPDVVSFARSDAGLASGLWRVELRAGARVVRRLSIRVAA